MLRIILLILPVIFLTANLVNAQEKQLNSVENLARQDVKKFNLDKATFKEFRKDRNGHANADYFKPTAAFTSDPSLLKDSTYVKTFRALAYQKTRRKRSVGHYLLIGGVSFGVAIGITTLAVSSTR